MGILQGVYGETRNAYQILVFDLYGEYKYNKLLGKYFVGFTLYLMGGFWC